MSTQKKKFELFRRLGELGFSYEEAVQLRRIELTLQSWAERECGDGSDWAIERDETTGKPFNVYHVEGKPRRYPIADREGGAMKRLAKIMEAHPELWAYSQGDCRGCMLHVGRKADLRTTENQIVRKAHDYGAKIDFRDIEGRAPSGCWIVLDMHGTELFHQTFNTEELAAESFLKFRKLDVPAREVLPVSQYYNRGLAVCA